MYFFKLLNGEVREDLQSREREYSDRQLNPQVCGHVSKDEIKEALKKMTNGKTEDPDQITVKVWKCLGE